MLGIEIAVCDRLPEQSPHLVDIVDDLLKVLFDLYVQADLRGAVTQARWDTLKFAMEDWRNRPAPIHQWRVFGVSLVMWTLSLV